MFSRFANQDDGEKLTDRKRDRTVATAARCVTFPLMLALTVRRQGTYRAQHNNTAESNQNGRCITAKCIFRIPRLNFGGSHPAAVLPGPCPLDENHCCLREQKRFPI
jgi:hypothetical protein